MKIHKTSTVLSHLIPLQDILKTDQSTTIEQTTPNIQPYLEIYKDANYSDGKIGFSNKQLTIKNHLDNPQLATVLTQDTTNSETVIQSYGSMETMRAGDRKAYTHHWDDSNWYTFDKTNGENYPVNYLPEWGGSRQWSKPSGGIGRFNPMNTDQHHALYFRMTPVLDINSKIMPFRCRVLVQREIVFTVRLPPDGNGTYAGDVYTQHVHKLQTQSDTITYQHNHPF